jgi:hypothetical protein
MAVKAHLSQYDDDRFVNLDWYVDERRVRSTDDYPSPGYEPDAHMFFYWDDEKIEDLGEHDFLGVEIIDISELSDKDLDAIDRLDPPRIDVLEEGPFDVSVTDVLRRARTKRLSHIKRVTV